MRFCKTSLFVLMTVTLFFTQAGVAPSDAEAGPLMDFLFKHRQNKVARRTAYYPQADGCTTCTQTCNRVVASYVPYTAYRTCYEQIPVTYYQRTSSTDPCTGCTITCNKPCTTYRMQSKRVPYTAYRTVYRTETVTTPIAAPCSTCPSPCSTCQSPCATCNAPATAQYYGAPTGGCATCAGGGQTAPQGYQTVSPATYTPIQPYAPSTGYSNAGGAADTQPSLSPGGYSQSNISNYPTPANPETRTDTRSVIKDLEDQYRDYQDEQQIELRSPSTNNSGASTRRSFPGNNIRGMQQQPVGRSAYNAPTQQQWGYSPRLASHRQYDREPANNGFESDTRRETTFRSTSRTESNSRTNSVNQGWSSGN